MRTAVLLVAVLVAAPAGAAATSSGLQGLVTRGPITPVCIAGQPCSAPAKYVNLLFSRNGLLVARTKTDVNGRYRVRLAPGIYRVSLTGKPRIGRGLEPDWVRVRAGRYVRMDLSIDTGIR